MIAICCSSLNLSLSLPQRGEGLFGFLKEGHPTGGKPSCEEKKRKRPKRKIYQLLQCRSHVSWSRRSVSEKSPMWIIVAFVSFCRKPILGLSVRDLKKFDIF